MTTLVRVLDRLVTAVVALVLLLAGTWLIGYRRGLPLAREAATRLDPAAFTRVPDSAWWPAALAAGGLVAVLLGLWLMLMHLRPRAVRTVAGAAGTVDFYRLADAAAGDLSRHPSVQHAKAATRTERGRPVMRITAGLAEHTPTDEVRRLARRIEADVRRAAGYDFEFQLLVKQVRPDKVRPQVT